MAALFRTSGIVVPVRPRNKKGGLSRQEVQTLPGRTVHLVPLDRDRIMLMQAIPSEPQVDNQNATALLHRAIHARKAPADEITGIRGDVLVTNYKELAMRQILASTELAF